MMDLNQNSDDEDSDIAPPSDGEPDQQKGAADISPSVGQRTEEKTAKGHSIDIAEISKRKGARSTVFAPAGSAPASSAKGPLPPPGTSVPTGGASSAIETVFVPKDVHELQQALKYRMMMQPKSVPLTPSDEANMNALLSNYLVAHGFHRTATALRSAMNSSAAEKVARGVVGSGNFLVDDQHLQVSKNDVAAVVGDTTRKVGLLFDDDSAWPTDNMTQNYIGLQVIDQHSGAAGGTLETLLEKLFFDDESFSLSDRGEATVIDMASITFSSIFVVMNCCFVTPDALFSRISKIFKTVSVQQSLLDEERRLILLKRLLSFLVKWVSVCSVDFRRVTLERIGSFVMSIIQGSGQHYEVVQMASALLQLLHAMIEARSSGSYAVPCPSLPLKQVEAVSATVSVELEVRKLTDCPDTELARQLSLAHFELMREVRPRELLNAAWTEAPMKAITDRLNAFVEFAGEITLWFASMIVSPQDVDVRKANYAKCIRLAHQLYNMQNHFLAKALLSACDHQAVAPLVNNNMLTTDETESRDSLRATLDISRLQSKKELTMAMDSACIPHASSYLTLMSRSHESVKTILLTSTGTPLINWSKMITMGKVLLSFISLQSVPYAYQPLPNFQKFISQMPGKRDENSLLALSQERQRSRRNK